VPRVARLNELLREILADELERIDDERLDLVTITNVDVDADLNRAIVRYDSFAGVEGDARILEALSERRVRLQAALGRQMRVRKTPILEFRPDEVLRSAERIDDILRSNPLPERPEPESDPELDREFDEELDHVTDSPHEETEP
jgi:ribosome-binding factor A